MTLLVNPTAGGGRALRRAEDAVRLLQARGARPSTVPTRDARHVAQAAAEAFDRGDVVVAVGGDGMLRLVADVAAGREHAVVGLLPAGRGNDFARFLGLPTDIGRAVDTLLDGEVLAVDTGVATDVHGVARTFLSLVSVGFDAEANRIANAAPSRLGGLVYVWGMLGALAGLRPIPFRLVADGVPRGDQGLFLAVANAGAYGGGMHMAPHASVCDGLLDVVVVRHRGLRADRCDWRDRLRLLRFLPRVFRGTHVANPSVDVTRAGTLVVDADAPLVAYADGDPIGVLPLTIGVRSRSLRLLVPARDALRPRALAPDAEVPA